MRNQCLRLARDCDIPIIESWLPSGPNVETLSMNWNIARNEHQVGRLHVWQDETSELPIAYTWGTMNGPDSVLEVHPAYRRRGIGRAIAAELIERARADGEPLLEVECAPASSEPFWQSMGFETRGVRTVIGRQIIRVLQEVPYGPVVPVTVEFHKEGYLYEEPRPAPISTHQLKGNLGANGLIYFDELVAEFDLDNGRNLVVRIVVDGEEVFADKAKYTEARNFGVFSCQGGFKLGWTRGLDAHRAD